jgi:TPR repeat protein
LHLEEFVLKKIVAAFIATLIFTSTGSLLAQDFDKGFSAYEAGDFASALKEFEPLAEQGNANAQFNLGVMYDNG